MLERIEIAKNWLPRYTGMALDDFGDYILLTNFRHYLVSFASKLWEQLPLSYASFPNTST